MLIAMAGLPASGKSSLASALQRALPATVLDKDSVRNFLFTEHVDYSQAQNDLCMRVIYDTACYLLRKQSPPNLILDGRTYSRGYQIDALKQTAKKSQAKLFIIECFCSDDEARIRLEQDKDTHVAQDRNFSLYLQSKARAEPICEAKLLVDTENNSSQQCLEMALNYLSSGL